MRIQGDVINITRHWIKVHHWSTRYVFTFTWSQSKVPARFCYVQCQYTHFSVLGIKKKRGFQSKAWHIIDRIYTPLHHRLVSQHKRNLRRLKYWLCPHFVVPNNATNKNLQNLENPQISPSCRPSIKANKFYFFAFSCSDLSKETPKNGRERWPFIFCI